MNFGNSYPVWGAEEINRLIQAHLSLVDFWVDRMRTQVPAYLSRDEIASAARLGLVDAAHRFDPQKGVLFKTFAEQRIRGAVFDEVRRMDWASRTGREKYSRLSEAMGNLEKKLGRSPGEEEMAHEMGVSLDDYRKLLTEVSCLSFLSLEETIAGSDEGKTLMESLEDTQGKNPQELYENHELAEIVAECLERLPEKERLVVSLYYYEECTQKEIAEILELTEGRVSQLHSQALVRLKTRMKQVLGR
ncbi:MAG: FliA/WhiG family RNA polymerase sigma factor [Deltaproteobacteria bacterium]|nr:FliA/WhiG family RNA polymerase sigma factor [Deltaproteobacteria bacterium]